MLAKDVMTTAVVSATEDADVREVARLLAENRISAVPVLDAEGRIVGILSEGDLIRRAEIGTEKSRGSWWLSLFEMPEQLAREYTKSHGRRAGDVMTRNVFTVTEDTPLAEIANILETNHIKRVPVVRDGRAVGIVSRANLLHGLAAAKAHVAERTSATDSEIREKLLENLQHEDWVQRALVNVTVEDGTAHIWGMADTREQIKATEIAANELPGVKSVVNHMSVIEPYFFYTE